MEEKIQEKKNPTRSCKLPQLECRHSMPSVAAHSRCMVPALDQICHKPAAARWAEATARSRASQTPKRLI